MATSRNLFNATLDAATELKDAGAVTADGAAEVDGAARVVNLGNGLAEMILVIDVDALTTGGASAETYDLILQGSSDATFATDVNEIHRVRVDAQNEIGRYAVPVMNTTSGGNILPYVRMYHDVGGTTPSVNYRAYLTISNLR